jgi:hypothetical protein
LAKAAGQWQDYLKSLGSPSMELAGLIKQYSEGGKKTPRPKANVPPPPEFINQAQPQQNQQKQIPKPYFMQNQQEQDPMPVATLSRERSNIPDLHANAAEIERREAEREAKYREELKKYKNRRKPPEQDSAPNPKVQVAPQPDADPYAGTVPVNTLNPGVEFKPPKLKKENKIMIQNKKQLKEAIQRSLIKEIRVSRAKKVLKEQLTIQVNARNTAKALLSEGPLSNVWQGIKDAGSSMFGTKPKVGGKAFMGQASSDAMRTNAAQQTKEIVSVITKAISKVHSQKQKWNSQILKNNELINHYHDAVVQAYELYAQYGESLGPAGAEVNRQINELIENLKSDLMSEVTQIETMIQSLTKKDVSIDELLKTHKQDAEERRERQADLNPAGVTSFQRGMPSVRGGSATSGEQMRKLRPDSEAKEDKSSKKDDDNEAWQRIQYTDQAQYKKYEKSVKQLNTHFQKVKDELSQEIRAAKSAEERKAVLDKMQKLAKSYASKKKEIEASLKGIGIRSKGGKTLLRKSVQGK